MGESVTVRFFAQARETVGRSTVRFALPSEGLTLDGLLARLGREHPGLRRWLPVCRVARNGAYVAEGVVRLRDGDEIALHPPYSGG